VTAQSVAMIKERKRNGHNRKH